MNSSFFADSMNNFFLLQLMIGEWIMGNLEDHVIDPLLHEAPMAAEA